MAGFTVHETLSQPPAAVWAYLTDFRHADQWMSGIGGMAQTSEGPLAVGTRLRFEARGKQRETVVSALEPSRSIALTSNQGGVSATYTYTLTPRAMAPGSPRCGLPGHGAVAAAAPADRIRDEEERFVPARQSQDSNGRCE